LILIPDEKSEIKITIEINESNYEELLYPKSSNFTVVLILRIKNGGDKFIILSGEYEISFIGNSLEFLSNLGDTPIKKIDNNFKISKKHKVIPKELISLMEFIIDNKKENDNLFLLYNKDEDEEKNLISIIDNIGYIPDDYNGSIHTVASVLISFLENLVNPIIPYKYYTKVVYEENFKIDDIEESFSLHKMCLLYILNSIGIIISKNSSKSQNEAIILLFSDVLLRHPKNKRSSEVQKQSIYFFKKELTDIFK
jgi:hypothetical protein